jgi:SAM-dependent methyltransferase
MDLLEISPGDKKDWAEIGFKSYTTTDFPEFDICAEKLDRTFDVIVSDHVFEHLEHPLQAAQNIFEMLKPGGHFVIAVPFLVKIHGRPYDFNRWTPDGMKRLLKNAGFSEDTIEIQSWGNRKCLKANLDKWKIYGWHKDLTNEPDYPQVVWGWARKG